MRVWGGGVKVLERSLGCKTRKKSTASDEECKEYKWCLVEGEAGRKAGRVQLNRRIGLVGADSTR